MAVYELRTYQVVVGKMKDAVSAYNNKGWPALQKGGYDKKLVGYFVSDTGGLHQLSIYGNLTMIRTVVIIGIACFQMMIL